MARGAGANGDRMMSEVLFLGHGYSAGYVASRLAAKGWRVTGTARTAGGALRIRGAGYTGLVFDGSAPEPALAEAIARATHIVVSIPPDAEGDPVLRWHAGGIIRSASLQWIGYLSTVGVYGNRDGETVDESTEPQPQSERSIRRLEAEQEWRDLGAQVPCPVAVVRIAGIYGPGRSAIDNVIAGTARRIVKPGQVFNRIHVADLAQIVVAAAKLNIGGVLHGSDALPAPGDEVVAHAAELLGRPSPPAIPIENAGLSAMGRSFYDECKRVSSASTLQTLGIKLLYPTYKEGLGAILSEVRSG